MAENTPIEWTDHTFNPWVGCTRISPACDHCYAADWARRAGKPGLWEPGAERQRTSADNWRKPLKWNRDSAAQVAAGGRRIRVFCASLADVFDNQVPPEWRADLWALIRATPDLDWQLLSKRPQNIPDMLPPDWGDGWPNVWLGTTVEDQERADRNIPHLLAIPARVRFLSVEPLLGPVDMTRVTYPRRYGSGLLDALRGTARGHNDVPLGLYADGARIHWVIVGGESGPKGRPMLGAWVRAIRDQCAAATVAFLFKQWGEWSPVTMKGDSLDDPESVAAYPDPGCSPEGSHTGSQPCRFWQDGRWVYWTDIEALPTPGARRIGKARAGNTLDGRTHLEFPEPRA